MSDFTLYMSFPSDNGTWYEVSLLPMCDLTETPIGKMPNTRFDWGELTIKNEPLNYKSTPSDRYKLYDLIKAEDPTANIQIKFISNEFPNGIFGYFGVIDCDIDNDNLLIKINPTISDVYSPIIENKENEIKLFDENNIVVNPMFALATNLIPDNWTVNTVGYLKLERIWLNNDTAVKISDEYYDGRNLSTEIGYVYNPIIGGWDASTNTPNLELISNPNSGDVYFATVSGTHTNKWGSWYYDSGIDQKKGIMYSNVYKAWLPYLGRPTLFPTDPMGFYQTNPLIIQKYKQIKFSFSYFFSGTSTRLKSGYFDIELIDSVTSDVYRLQKTSTSGYIWVPEVSWVSPVRYDSGRTCIELASFDKYKRFSTIIPELPVTGTIKATFYRAYDTNVLETGWDPNCALILTGIELSVAEIELKTIKVNFNPENLNTLEQGSDKIYWKNKSINNDIYFRRRRKDKDTNQLSDYIDTVTGEPKMTTLCDSEYGIRSQVSSLYYGDLLKFFDSDRTKESYKFELSELTVFRGKYISGNYRDWFAVAKFSREEIRKKDPDGWSDSDGYSEDVLPPPVSDSGWDYTYDVDSTGRLWVRKPFNEMAVAWEVEAIKGDGTLQNYNKRFDYYYSLTTKKAYPINTDKSFELNTAIDLRELIRKVYTETHVDLKGKQVYSSFFWNDCEPAGALPDATLQGQLNLINYPGANYATLTDKSTGVQPKNPLKNIAAIHTYKLREAADQKINDEDSILKVSFEKLFDELNFHFNYQLYYFVDSDYNLHIEHFKYYDKTNTPIDMNAAQFAYIRNYQSWKYDKSEMFSLIEFESVNAGYTDFKTSKITFDKLPSNKRKEDIKSSNATKYISTDIQFCKENPTSLSNGIILIAYDVVGTDNIARYGIGQKSGSLVINGDLSISSLLYNFGRYEGTWKEGYINDKKKVIFENTKRSIEGKEITFKGILTANNIDNNIGSGLIKSKVIDYNSQITKVVLKYRYVNYYSPTSTGDILIVPTLSIVETDSLVTVISSSSVSCSGNVTSDGNDPVTERGICYSTDPSAVSTADTKVTAGTGTGTFSSTLTGLASATNYYFRAYSINSIGTSYGTIYIFINDIPTVTTSSVITGIGSTVATCGGEVVSDGGEAVTERGICYSEFPLNITNGFKLAMGSGVSAFTGELTGLTSETRYYIRAYATNANGTVYGNRKSFTTTA